VANDSDLRRGLSTLLVLRASVVTVLLLATVYVNVGSLLAFEAPTTRFLLILTGGTYLMTGAYALLHRRLGDHAGFARGQIAVDSLVWTALVYATGGGASGFTFLYGLEVVLASALLGRSGALWAALVSWLLFAAVTTGLAQGWIPVLADQAHAFERLPAGEIAYTLLVNGVMVLLVATLSGVLAERVRRAGGALRVAVRREEDIVRSVTSGLLTVDLSGRVETLNPAGAQIVARAPEDAVGRPLSEVLPAAASALAAKRPRGEGEHLRPDGTQIPIGFSLSPLTDRDGQGAGRIVIFQDMTEILAMRRAVADSERLAALGRVAAGLAHEIRNPLGAISGSVEMLRSASALGEEDRDLLGLVLDETKRLNALVGDILHFARPRAAQPVRVDVAALARDVATIFRRGSAAHGAAIEVEAPATLEGEVDPAQVRQVLWNLLKNAAQAAPGGSPVRLRILQAESGLRIEVIDTGPGIAAEERSRIFDPFHTGKDHGIGIGLALVKQIVDAHGGTIEVDSEPGQGATFRVTLPVTAA